MSDGDPSRSSGRFASSDVDPSRSSGRIDKVDAADLHLPIPDEQHPRAGVRVHRRRRLQLLAAQQAGCFTIADTVRAGYDRRARHHHLSYGNWRRTAAPGVFRLTGWPPDPYEHLRVWLLWVGCGYSLTSWSSLLVRGLVPDDLLAVVSIPSPVRGVVPPTSGPRASVDAPGFAPTRTAHLHGPSPTGRRDRVDTTPYDSGAVRLHPEALKRRADEVAGFPARPVAEAVCIALRTSSGPHLMAATDLAHRLIDANVITLREFFDAAVDVGGNRAIEVFWSRSGSALLSA